MKTWFSTLLECPLPQTWLLNPGISDGDNLCAMAMSWIQLFALQCLLCPALSPSSEGPSLPASPTLWQGRRQSHEHIFTPFLPNTHRMTVKPKHVLQLHLISFDGHVSATKPSPQLQRNCYFNSPVPTQANASAAQGNQHPLLTDYATRVERKQLNV